MSVKAVGAERRSARKLQSRESLDAVGADLRSAGKLKEEA